MKIYIHADEGDHLTPIEIANAFINNRIESTYRKTYNKQVRDELAAIAEHIQVYVKYNNCDE